MKVGWLCTSGPAPHQQETAPTHPHFCLTGSQPVPRDTSDPDDPCPPRCQQLPAHTGPRCPAHCSVSGSLCNTPAPTRACPWRMHIRSSRSLSTLQPWAVGSAPRGRREELELGLSRAGGPQSGTTWARRSAGHGARVREAVPPTVGSRWRQRALALGRDQVQITAPPTWCWAPSLPCEGSEAGNWALTMQQRPPPPRLSPPATRGLLSFG